MGSAATPTDPGDLVDEADYDRLRLTQWLDGRARGDGLHRRDVLRLAAGLGVATGLGPTIGPLLDSTAPASAGAVPVDARPVPVDAGSLSTAGPIVKPLPPALFHVSGTNAEMRWEAMAGQGYLVPIDRFFVRNHTHTPMLDAATWRLRLFGDGLRGAPGPAEAVELTYGQLRRLPAETITAYVECAGNGRSFFTSQQGQTVSGTPWRLGAIGVARWRGVRLGTVLTYAGITPDAVDVMPSGLDPDFVTGGINLGPVRRPLPVRKAMHDVLLAYEMNGEPLPPDHGFPVRLVVPSWIGISSIKWLGQVEVSTTPLFSPWNTQFYRLFGPDQPTSGTLVDRQVVKSALELPWNAGLTAGRWHVVRGRSWSGNGGIALVEVSTDEGATWNRARLTGPGLPRAWQSWKFRWRPATPGAHTIRVRATDTTGAGQPEVAPYNTLGYLFGAVVAHPVTVT